VECPSILRSYRWGRRRSLWGDPDSRGETEGYGLSD
jgi:hypothetical protein